MPVLVRELPIYSGRWVGLQEVVWSKDEDHKSHLHGNSIQDSKQSTISDFTT